MKKYVILVLALVLAMTIAACSTDKKKDGTTTDANGKDTTVLIEDTKNASEADASTTSGNGGESDYIGETVQLLDEDLQQPTDSSGNPVTTTTTKPAQTTKQGETTKQESFTTPIIPID